MTVGGIQGGAGSNASPAFAVSSSEKDVQPKIVNLQAQIQKLGSEQGMDSSEKSEKRQELSSRLSELRKELREQQLEKQKEKREELLQTMEEETSGDKLEGQGKADSKEQVHSVLTGMGQDRQRQVQKQADTGREGEKRILESEIRIDQIRGADIKQQEKKLEHLESKEERIRGMQTKPDNQADEDGRMTIIRGKKTGMKRLGNQDEVLNFSSGSYQL